MKRFAAIMLLSVHLFYIGGYALVFQYFIHQSDVQIAKQIDDNKVDSAKLFEIKIPVNLPYITDWAEYKNIEGQVQFNGVYYNYVKLKMARDTMSLICMPNNAKTRLSNANIIITKQINDIPLTKKGHNIPSVKKGTYANEYNYQTTLYHYWAFGTNLKLNSTPISTRLIISPFIESPGKPPNFIS